MPKKHRYQPDYAVPPGAVLEEYLAARRLSTAAFAHRCGLSCLGGLRRSLARTSRNFKALESTMRFEVRHDAFGQDDNGAAGVSNVA